MHNITNIQYSSAVSDIKKIFCILRKEAVNISEGVIGGSLCKDDFYFLASIDRCIRLIDGMTEMLEKRNLTCAGALLRMQMDNCMRTYAAYIAEDKNAVLDSVISGDPINKLKDKDGKPLTDSNLKNKLNNIDKRFGSVYSQSSGYIHLSDKAFYQTVDTCENYKIGFQIGLELPEKRNENLLECAEAFVYYCKLHFRLLKPVVESKKRLDEELDNNEQHI